MDLPIAERWSYIRLLSEQLDHERDSVRDAQRGG